MAIYPLYHLNQFQRMSASTNLDTFFPRFFHCFSVFSTGLVRLYIARLPLRSCQTIGAPSVQGSAQCPFFRFWQQQDSKPCPGDDHADVLMLRHFDPQNIEWAEWLTSCNGTTVHPPLLNNCVYIYIYVCVCVWNFRVSIRKQLFKKYTFHFHLQVHLSKYKKKVVHIPIPIPAIPHSGYCADKLMSIVAINYAHRFC